jgi:cellulose synthase/poly-beta-1,6-N-acetylglucosamine synthase-like glycosyltransferase
MILFDLGAALWAYAYAGYPFTLALAAPRRRTPVHPLVRAIPRITIVVPAYNEAATIAATLESLLAIEYPADRRQVLVLSDASTDGTDAIVASFAPRGVELVRMAVRAGKTSAENNARARITGDIVINTDASVRVDPAALKALLSEFADPTVGVASARDVSVVHLADARAAGNAGESAYVGYEMWIRDLETRAGGIVGASGCLYAIRRSIHDYALPGSLSRDFAAALEARRCGFRAVSVIGAVCFVPRGTSLHQEYRRKVRTMTRGLATLMHYRALLNPFRYGAFAWMLASHKLCRWLLPWASLAMVASLAVASAAHPFARFVLGATLLAAVIAAVGWRWPADRVMPRLVSLPSYLLTGIIAGLHAWVRLFGDKPAPTWEPTRRGTPAHP